MVVKIGAIENLHDKKVCCGARPTGRASPGRAENELRHSCIIVKRKDEEKGIFVDSQHELFLPLGMLLFFPRVEGGVEKISGRVQDAHKPTSLFWRMFLRRFFWRMFPPGGEKDFPTSLFLEDVPIVG